MFFKEAYEALKQGAIVKLPEWSGYWRWEDNSIKMHCKDGKVLDIRETDNLPWQKCSGIPKPTKKHEQHRGRTAGSKNDGCRQIRCLCRRT